MDKVQRPLRIAEHVALEIAEPAFARAGEKSSWKIPFVLSRDVSAEQRLVLFAHGGRNNKPAWGSLQIEKPGQEGYIALFAPDRSRLRPLGRYGGERSGVFGFEVPEHGFREGDQLVMELGGEAGAVAPAIALASKLFLLFAFPNEEKPPPPLTLFGNVLYNMIGACLLDIKGGRLSAIRAYTGSNAVAGQELSVLVRPEDEFGNVASDKPGKLAVRINGEKVRVQRRALENSNCCLLTGVVLPRANVYRLEIEDTAHGLKTMTNPVRCCKKAPDNTVLWGMIHGHTEISDGCGSLDHYFNYMRDECGLDFGATGDHDHLFETSDDMWSMTQEAVLKYNQPGRFTTFLGYEWAKWRKNGDGDRNVYYLKDRRPMFRSDDGCYSSPADLFQALQNETALVIPHHTAEKGNHCDFKDHDPEKERLIEIYSVWGNSERSVHQGNPFPVTDMSSDGGPYGSGEVPSGFVQRALQLGWRVGFTAGGDDHRAHAGDQIKGDGSYRAGLLAVCARENTREALWEALWNRHCYGTTGARIILDFKLNGHPMGTELLVSEHPDLVGSRKISVAVCGTAKIGRVEIVRNNTDLHTFNAGCCDADFEWDDNDSLQDINLPPARYSSVPFAFYYVRVTQEDGEMAWASPIWILS